MDTAMRKSVLFLVLVCGCGGIAKQEVAEERQKSGTVVDASEGVPTRHAAPSWATPKSGTAYDAKTGLPNEVMDRETGIELMLVPTGELRVRTPDGPKTLKNMRTFYLSKDPVSAVVWGKYMGSDAPFPAVLDFDFEIGQCYFAVILAFEGDQEFFARTEFRAPTLSEVDHGDAYWEAGRLDEPPFVTRRRVFLSLRVARDP